MHRTFFALLLLGFIFLSFLLFGASLFHDFATLDDRYLVVQNVFIQGISLRNIHYIFTHFDPELYIPFTFLSFQINYLMSGLGAWSYHLTNILLHSANSALVALISWQLTQKRWLAVLAGLLFCVHPLNTEAVVWVAGRKDLLAVFFALLSTYYYQLSTINYQRSQSKNRNNWLSLFFFLCALLSKASVITLPLVFFLMHYARASVSSKKEMIPAFIRGFTKVVPFFALSILFGAIALFGKGSVIQSSTALQTVLMAMKSTVFYLEKFFVPIGLNPLYPYQESITLLSPDFFIPIIILLILFGCILLSLRFTSTIALGFASFFILLAPSFLNFHKGDITFIGVDRYMYLPMIPLIILLLSACVQLYEKREMRWKKALGIAIATIILLMLSVLSWKQTKLWGDEELLFVSALEKDPKNIPARMSVALVYRERGEVNAQESVMREGLREHPYIGYHLDLASIALQKGDLLGAEKEIEQAEKMNSDYPDVSFYRASLKEVQKKSEEALRYYQKAFAEDPSYAAAYLNAGAILRDLQKDDEAEKMFRIALSWNPSFFEALINLAHLLIDHERSAEALPLLQDAFALSSNDADIGNTLAYQLIIAGKKREAQEVIDAVLRVHPENRTARRMKNEE